MTSGRVFARSKAIAYMTLTRHGLPHEIVKKILHTANVRSTRISRLVKKLRRKLLTLRYSVPLLRRFAIGIRPYRTANFMRYEFNFRDMRNPYMKATTTTTAGLQARQVSDSASGSEQHKR